MTKAKGGILYSDR